jgi:hypothetical protein
MDTTDYVTVPGQLFACLSIVGPECPQRNDKFGIKIRGAFPTRDEAERHAKRLQKEDATFDIYVVDMYKWLLIPPDREKIEDVHYANEKLEEIFSKYRENQRMAASLFERRKKDMSAKPLDGTETPYIDPSDENSKYYTKPDVPPIPHPSEFIEQIQKENPEMPIEEVVKLADKKVQEEIDKRAKENNNGTIVEENEDEVRDSDDPSTSGGGTITGQ